MTKARNLADNALSTVSPTELGFLDGVTSAVQTQIDGKTGKSTLTTTGDIYYASAANTPARLAIGSTSDVLTVAGGIPSWAAPAGGGGKVLQVVSATTSTQATITTNTYTDTNITATITPTANTSQILVIISANVFTYNNSGTVTYVQSGGRIMRGATAILTNDTYHQVEGASVSNYMSIAGQQSFTYLDSPATTSATTYKLQGKSNVGTGVAYNAGSQTSVITLLEIGA